MPKLKTRKSVSKRIKITGNGKVSRRRSRQNHFNAKQDGDHIREKRNDQIITGKVANNIITDIKASL